MTRGKTHARLDWLEYSHRFRKPNRTLLSVLARSFLAGEPSVEQTFQRASLALGRRWRWLRGVARRYLAMVDGRTRPRQREVIEFLRNDEEFQSAWSEHSSEIRIQHWLTEPPQMQPVAAAATWPLPVIETAGALAAWLELEPDELDWFADLKGLCRTSTRQHLGHYHYRVLTKPSGNVRLIEAPKPRLKELQRRILAGILEKIPPHTAVHGFLKGHSIKTFAAPHVGQSVVLRMDLEDFFPSFAAARIQTLFRTLGYPELVADLLGGICTNAVPRAILKDPLYVRPHLPQGAPSSPALANLCTYRGDCRLLGLAQAAGARYTRYADDLAFSGGKEFERSMEAFSTRAAAILIEEGFTVNFRKTRVMRQGVRQHLAGLVANERLNVRRSDFDQLKAILTNCVRLGPESQNRDGHADFRAHLNGRVGFIEHINPDKGRRLRAIFERIQWPRPLE